MQATCVAEVVRGMLLVSSHCLAKAPQGSLGGRVVRLLADNREAEGLGNLIYLVERAFCFIFCQSREAIIEELSGVAGDFERLSKMQAIDKQLKSEFVVASQKSIELIKKAESLLEEVEGVALEQRAGYKVLLTLVQKIQRLAASVEARLHTAELPDELRSVVTALEFRFKGSSHADRIAIACC
jgi:hypothetical protein